MMMPKRYMQTQCSICKRSISEDMSLPCEHKYCKDCLTSAVKLTQKFECPECKLEFDGSSVGLSSLILTAPLSTELYCSVQGHGSKALDIFCEDHNVIICTKCLFSTHKVCTTCEVDELSAEAKQQLDNILKNAEDFHASLEATEKETMMVLEEAEDKLASIKKSVLPIYAQRKEAVMNIIQQVKHLRDEASAVTMSQQRMNLDSQFKELSTKTFETVSCNIEVKEIKPSIVCIGTEAQSPPQTQKTQPQQPQRTLQGHTESMKDAIEQKFRGTLQQPPPKDGKPVPPNKPQQRSLEPIKKMVQMIERPHERDSSQPRGLEGTSKIEILECAADGSSITLNNAHLHPRRIEMGETLSGHQVVQKTHGSEHIFTEFELDGRFSIWKGHIVKLHAGDGQCQYNRYSTKGDCYTGIPSWQTGSNIITQILDKTGKKVHTHKKQ